MVELCGGGGAGQPGVTQAPAYGGSSSSCFVNHTFNLTTNTTVSWFVGHGASTGQPAESSTMSYGALTLTAVHGTSPLNVIVVGRVRGTRGQPARGDT